MSIYRMTILSLLVATLSATAQVPHFIHYQGRLINGTNLVNGVIGLTLRLYNTSTGGSALCTDSNQVAVVDGLYATFLGDDAAPGSLPAALLNEQVWIEAEVNGVALSPRERLAAVGYSLMASGVSTGAITSAMLHDGAITSAKIAGGAIQSNHLALGAVQGQNIALGAIQAGHIGVGQITSNKIAAGAVGVTQLAKAYQAGRIAFSTTYGPESNDYRFSSMGATQTVSFAPPFDVSPIVTVAATDPEDALIEALHPRIRHLSSNDMEIVHEVPQGPGICLNTNRAGDCSLGIIQGRPAVAFRANNYEDLQYMSALDENGTAWADPVVVATGISASALSLLEVNGRPAIAYYDARSATKDLLYVRASNLYGTAWAAPVQVDTNGMVGNYASMAIISGNPAIAYYDDTSNDVMYVRADNLNGTSWRAPVRVCATNDVGLYCSLAIVSSNPAIAYYDATDHRLMFVRSSDLYGDSASVWGAPVVVLNDYGAGSDGLSLIEVRKYPLIAYANSSSGTVHCITTGETNGASWYSPDLLATNMETRGVVSACLIDGYPSIAWVDDTTDQILFNRGDYNGIYWDDAPVVAGLFKDPDRPWGCVLQQVNGNPAVAYYEYNREELHFVRSGNPPTNAAVNWIAVEP